MAKKPTYEELEQRIEALQDEVLQLKQSEEALRESEPRLQKKFDNNLLPGGDADAVALNLAEIIEIQAIQSMMDDFFKLTNIGIAILDLQGKILVATGWQDICTQFHRIHPESCKNCLKSDLELSNGVEAGTFRIYRCENNMWDMATPITVGDKRVGNLYLGQFLFEDEMPDIEVFRSQAQKYGFNEEEYLAALERVPRWSREIVNTVMNFYTRLANMISELGYSNIRIAQTLKDRNNLLNSLRESEARFRAIATNTPDHIIIQDKDLRYVWVLNPQLGLTEKDMIGKKDFDITSKEDAAILTEIKTRVLGTGNPEFVKVPLVSLNGDMQHFEGSYIPRRDQEGNIDGLIGYFRNVTERVKREEALRESEAYFREITENSSDIIVVLDEKGRLTYISPSVERFLGYNPEELIGKSVFDFIHPEDIQRAMLDFDAAVSTEETAIPNSFRVLHKDGSARVLEGLGKNLLHHPTVSGFIMNVHDITARVSAEQAVRTAAKRWQTTFDAMLDPIALLARDGTVEQCNEAFAAFLGQETGVVVGQKCYRLVHQTDTHIPGCPLVRALKNGMRETMELPVGEKTFFVVTDPIQSPDGQVTGFVHIMRDITEFKRLQGQLQETRKMEAIATLAGGIAHQFNNALSSIIGNIDLLEMDHRKDDTMMETLKDMKASGRRMAHLTSQLLAYARGGKYNTQTMSLTTFVTDAMPLIEHTLNPGVRVETDLSPDVSAVKADPTQIQTVLSALMTNSNEAIQGPGRIRISTKNMELDQAFVKDHPGLKPGPYVCLSIEDDGKGMDDEVKDHIFEPFFTTHFIGRGLGMPAAYGIVTNHDGSISVDSEPGKGTTVSIYLPAFEAKEEVEEDLEQRTVSAPLIDPPTGEGTVLVIEDEEPLVELFRKILERLGYRVLQARTGEEAIEMAKTFDNRIDLALLDIKLPDMSGNQIYPLIMEARPNLKVVVCSGYSIDGPAQEILDAGAQAFIQKPFLISTLAEKLKEVLGGK